MELRGKKVIALGERDGVQAGAIAVCAARAGAQVVLEKTYCFVWTAAGALDLDGQEDIKQVAQRYRPEELVVLLGTPTPDSSRLYAMTVTGGDPSWAGALAGVALALPVYHITEEPVKALIAPADWEEHVALMEMAMDTEAIGQAVRGVREGVPRAWAPPIPGAAVFGGWDPLGMRGTVSRSLLFTDVFVPEEGMMRPRGAYYRAALTWPHMFMTLCPTSLGLAQAAFDFTAAYLRGDVPGAPRPPLRGLPTKQLAVAEMRVKLEQAKALFYRAIGEARVNPTKDDRLRAYATQYTVMGHANDVCRLAIRTCGGRSIFRSLPRERRYRDSPCGSLMLSWTAEICLDRLGRESLFEPGEQG